MDACGAQQVSQASGEKSVPWFRRIRGEFAAARWLRRLVRPCYSTAIILLRTYREVL